MSVTFSEILKTAEGLSASASKADFIESDCRSSASRAYYAALHAAFAALPEQFTPSEDELNNGRSHQIIIDNVLKWGRSVTPGRTEAQAIARDLAKLKQIRKVADYKLDDDFNAERGSEAMRRANSIISNSEYALKKMQPPRSA